MDAFVAHQKIILFSDRLAQKGLSQFWVSGGSPWGAHGTGRRYRSVQLATFVLHSFAKSPKGGTADVYLDGVLKQSVNYVGSMGSTQAPEFNPTYTVPIGNIPAGAHKLEIKNMNGVVYLDRICLESSSSNAQPLSGPGNTSNQSGSASAGQTSSSNYQSQSGAQEISVSAESSLNVPFKVVLVDPSGLTLQTADSVAGIATISGPVTQGGVYVIKVVNLSLGPLQFTATTTPTIKR